MKTELVLDWNTCQPELEGLYFTAVQYGENAGAFDFLEWKEGSWQGIDNQYVIAYVDIQTFKKHLPIKWPIESPDSLQFLTTKDHKSK
jgi:hypothetical protein